ncbi:MAG: ABC transporter ATP-binding protein [Acidobacteria bacterium]|nr:ABC transporter ATP-binding protein [Acidobacteriota bacterium]
MGPKQRRRPVFVFPAVAKRERTLLPESESAGVAIRTVGLTRRYRSGSGELTIFADMNFTVHCGERLALVGDSGTGKTTLLYLLGGLDHPTSGRIFYGQTEITALTGDALADFRNREIGFVWQNQSLLPEFTALENVMMPLLVRGEQPGTAAGQARARLADVGLADRETHRAGELSGGEQQRVALARALAGRPKVLFADEPTGNLDARTGARVVDLLEDLHRRMGLTSIYVTHNPEFAARADRVVRLAGGTLTDDTRGAHAGAAESGAGMPESGDTRTHV